MSTRHPDPAVTRRQLFRFGAGAVLAASAAPLLKSSHILWADGEHDDAAAISALLSGENVRIADAARSSVVARGGYLEGGTYLIGSPIIVGRTAQVTLTGLTIRTQFDGPLWLICDSTLANRSLVPL